MRKSHLRVSSANACVGKLLDGDGPRDEQDSSRLRGPYKILTPAQKFNIGKRAAEIGTTAAMRYVKNYSHLDLKETSVRRFKDNYQAQLKTSTKEISGNSTIQELVPKKRGRPLIVGESWMNK